MGGRYARSIYPIAFYTKSKIPDTVMSGVIYKLMYKTDIFSQFCTLPL